MATPSGGDARSIERTPFFRHDGADNSSGRVGCLVESRFQPVEGALDARVPIHFKALDDSVEVRTLAANLPFDARIRLHAWLRNDAATANRKVGLLDELNLLER